MSAYARQDLDTELADELRAKFRIRHRKRAQRRREEGSHVSFLTGTVDMMIEDETYEEAIQREVQVPAARPQIWGRCA